MFGGSPGFAEITKHYAGNCVEEKLRNESRMPWPARSTPNSYTRKNNPRTHWQPPMGGRLDLREQHELLKPLINAGRPCAGNDFETIDLAAIVEFALNGQRVCHFGITGACAKTPQRRFRRAGWLIDARLKDT